MYCTNCGQPLADGVTNCERCGNVNELSQSFDAKQEAISEEGFKAEISSNVLTWGIISLFFSSTGIIGLVLAIVARVNASHYKKQFGAFNGIAKTGNICSIVALTISIIRIATVFAVYAILILYMILMFGFFSNQGGSNIFA